MVVAVRCNQLTLFLFHVLNFPQRHLYGNPVTLTDRNSGTMVSRFSVGIPSGSQETSPKATSAVTGSMPLRGRFSIRPHTNIRPPPQQQRFPRFGTGAADGPPVRQTDREEEIASRALASHAQPFCNVQHITMSSISPKFIPLIIKDIRFSNLLDPAYSATKRPFCPISSQVQQMPFFRTSDYQEFL